MANDKSIFMRMTNIGHRRLEQSYLDGVPFLTSQWSLKLGVGSSGDYLNLNDLIQPVYDVNSSDYTGFIVHKAHEKYGRCAEFQVPLSIQDKIITEAGFLNPENELVLYGRIFIDYTKMQSEGVTQSTTVYVSLHSVPPDAIDLTINISNAFITNEQLEIKLNADISKHNTDPSAHTYLARLNGDQSQTFNVANAQQDTNAISLGQLKSEFRTKKTVHNLGEVSGSITLEYDKLYSAILTGDTTIVLAQPPNNNELYNVFFNFANKDGAHNLTLPSNSAYNNGIKPNFKVANNQRIIFETIDRGETVTAYYGKRG